MRNKTKWWQFTPRLSGWKDLKAKYPIHTCAPRTRPKPRTRARPHREGERAIISEVEEYYIKNLRFFATKCEKEYTSVSVGSKDAGENILGGMHLMSLYISFSASPTQTCTHIRAVIGHVRCGGKWCCSAPCTLWCAEWGNVAAPRCASTWRIESTTRIPGETFNGLTTHGSV